MKSVLLQKKHEDLLEACRNMTHEERLMAFLNHSQLMIQMHRSGEEYFTKKLSKNNSYLKGI